MISKLNQRSTFLQAAIKAKIKHEELKQLRWQISVIQRQEQSLESKREKLKIKLNLNQENKKLAETIRIQKEERYKELQKMISNLKNIKQQIKQKNNQYEQNMKKLKDLNGMLVFSDNTQNSNIKRSTGQIDKQTNIINKIQTKIDEIDLKIMQLQNMMEESDMKDQQNVQKLQNSKKQKQKLNKQLVNEKHKLVEFQNTKQILQTQASDLKLIIEQKISMKEQIEVQAKLLDSHLSDVEQEQQKQIKRLELLIQETQKQLKEIKQQLDKIIELKEQLQEKEKEKEKIFKLLVRQLESAKQKVQKVTTKSQNQQIQKEFEKIWLND